MYKLKEIVDNIYYVGVNDRQKGFFENIWPLPHGVSYNSFLINDQTTVLIDTVDICYSDIFFEKIATALKGRQLDYLISNHMEPDHAGCIGLLRNRYPGVKIIGNRHTFNMLNGYFGITEGLMEVKEGSTLNTGKYELEFYMAPMVHWPEVMFAYEKQEKILFSADAFGTFGTLNGGIFDEETDLSQYWDEMIRYYSNIIGKYGSAVQKALSKVRDRSINHICPTHGPVWRKHVKEVIDMYDRMSRYEGQEGVTIVYGSMYGNTEQMAEAIAFALANNGIKNIAMHNVSKNHASDILRDVFKYKGLIIGSPTYSNHLFPAVADILAKIQMRGVSKRIYSYFGSFTWAGAAVKYLAKFGEEMKWETTGIPVEEKQALKEANYQACLALGDAVAAKVKEAGNDER